MRTTSESDNAATKRLGAATSGPATKRANSGQLGAFRLLRELGRGGGGIVYEAEDVWLQRTVAVKVLPRSLGENSEALGRFLTEARAAARLQHPHVVAIYQVDRQDDWYFIAMELAAGGSLAGRLHERGRIPWREATKAVIEACRGLACAHAAGLTHRDLKPSNLLLAADETVKVADFGLCRGSDLTNHTVSGTVVGTPNFMSPEQCRGDPIGPASDFYSLGATYFALLTGQAPFEAENAYQVMFSHCSRPVPDPRTLQPDIPAGCFAVIQRAMEKQPAARYGSAEEMVRALDLVLHESQVVPPPVIESSKSTASVRLAKAPRIPWNGRLRQAGLWAAILLLLLSLAAWRFGKRQPEAVASTLPQPSLPKAAGEPRRTGWQMPSEPWNTRGQVAGLSWGRNAGEVQVGLIGSNGSWGCWDLAVGTKRLTAGGNVVALSVGGDGRSVCLLLDKGVMEERRIADTAILRSFQVVEKRRVTKAAGATDTLLFAVAVSSPVGGPGEVRIFNPTASRLGGWTARVSADSPECSALAISGDGQTVAWGVSGGGLRIWKTKTNEVRKLTSAVTSPSVVALDPIGQFVAVGSGRRGQGLVELFDATTGNRTTDLFPNEQVTAVAVHPTGKYLVVGLESGLLQVWDVGAGKPTERSKQLSGPVTALSLLNGQLLAAGTKWGEVSILQLRFLAPGMSRPDRAEQRKP